MFSLLNFTVLEPGLSSELWNNQSLFCLNSVETQYLYYITVYNSQNVHHLFGKSHKALNCTSL